MPINYNHYPPNWLTEIRPAILRRAGNCCEGSPAHPHCRARAGEASEVSDAKVVLTIAHMDRDLSNNHPRNLRALCQRCHLLHDTAQRMDSNRYGRDWQRAQLSLGFDEPEPTHIYQGDRMAWHLASRWCGRRVAAVRRADGKCIRGRNGNMLVEAGGKTVVLPGRQLRKLKARAKCLPCGSIVCHGADCPFI